MKNNNENKICFITTGDIKNNASSKRALGLANSLISLGWKVSILMEDTTENRHHIELECSNKVETYYFPKMKGNTERKWKEKKIKDINPDILYICAFVGRNIVGLKHKSKKIVEHCELQSKCANIKWYRRVYYCFCEFYSIIYADGLINASRFLEKLYSQRAKLMFKRNIPMLYLPYAYHPHRINIISRDKNEMYNDNLKYQTIFIYLGSIWREYGVFTIADAADILQEKKDSFVIYILGGGRDIKALIQYIKDKRLEDFVKVKGYVTEEQIEKYFSLASAFISPMNDTTQDWARCPSKLFMYLPYKKPIVTCKIGEPYEILKTSGMFYEAGSAEDMSVQMLHVIEGKEIPPNINEKRHTWTMRANEFSQWLKKYIVK